MYNEFEYTKRKLKEGVSIRQIARDLNVDHSTVHYWIKNGFTSSRNSGRLPDVDEIIDICKSNPSHYSYILGSYLGDGHIVKAGRSQKLTIYNDSRYSCIIKDQSNALQVLFPKNKIGNYKQLTSNCMEVMVHNISIPLMFPQHGPGKKHARDISLHDWQWDIVWEEPECFIKGLIDSDGCRYIHKQTIKGKTYAYPMYSFTNKSLDIINMYIRVMAKLDISTKPTQNKSGIINVFTNKAVDVEKLDKLYEIAENNLTR